ncbi:hypothetical protein G3H63_09250 [Microbacterium resistens]|uniref:hypothetical protein n=1 Tax=Microbacterium resistens TaxID=156977 RepID=UPI001C59A093|nr:hypothetical protein [Microbacterium resistens]MBW1639256.1 hypothetical protein [Microbacterium resistens]
MTMRDRLRGALTNVLSNATNYPEKVQVRILGQDVGPLTEKVTDAALAVFEEAQRKACTCREALGSHAVNCPAFEEAHTPSDDEREAWLAGERSVADAMHYAANPTDDERTPEFEALEQELFKHQPVLSMQDGGIAGCRCMDRVFHKRTEDWGTHLAEVFETLGFRRTVQGEPRITIEHGGGNTVTGTPAQVLNHAAITAALDAYRCAALRAAAEAEGGNRG